MRARLVNAVLRRVTIERLHVRELAVGDHSIVLDGNGVLFATQAGDPTVAPAGKARLAAVNGALRSCYNAGAWQNA